MSDPAPQQILAPAIRDFLGATPPLFCTLATTNADGSAHQTVLWFALRDDGTLLLNGMPGRRWVENLRREPRCSLLAGDAYRWVSVRGTTTPVTDDAQAHADIEALTHRYHAADPATIERAVTMFRGQPRISFTLRPRAVTDHL